MVFFAKSEMMDDALHSTLNRMYFIQSSIIGLYLPFRA
jgi:hypothetical protein